MKGRLGACTKGVLNLRFASNLIKRPLQFRPFYFEYTTY